jgi:hypothetical protein
MLQVTTSGVDVRHVSRLSVAGNDLVDGLSGLLLVGVRDPLRRQRVAVLWQSEADQGAIERVLDERPRLLDVGQEVLTAILGKNSYTLTFKGDSRRT